ncbi:hypothetical protein Tsubulata_007201, partial [Turnera subulata]
MKGNNWKSLPLHNLLHTSGLRRHFSSTSWRSTNKRGVATSAAVFSLCLALVALLFVGWFDASVFRAFSVLKSAPGVSNNTHKTLEFPLKCTTGNLTQTCPRNYPTKHNPQNHDRPSNLTCPPHFHWIHEDLRPWKETGITREMIEKGRRTAHFRLVIKDGKAYMEKYRQSIQTRDMFTLWGILQLLRLYPGRLPDLELFFDCDDRPVVPSMNFQGPNSGPPPLFRYCSDWQNLDIVFPDWSFWGWAETNIRPWKNILKDIKEGNKRIQWKDRDWVKESEQGYKQSNLEDQCTHRYKIYTEGWAWSVSEKYILACDSMTLYIRSRYHDFFIRGMVPLKHYWPIRDNSKCTSLKFAVAWGNNHTEEAEAIGKAAGNFMQEDLKMDYVYDYMFHLLNEYAKLLKFKPTIPPGAVELCSETLACPSNGTHKKFMMESLVMSPSESIPCTMPPPYDPHALGELIGSGIKTVKQVEAWENEYWRNQNNKQKSMKKNIGKSLQSFFQASGLHRQVSRKPWQSLSKKKATTGVVIFFLFLFIGIWVFADWLDELYTFRRINFQAPSSTLSTKLPKRCHTSNTEIACASNYPTKQNLTNQARPSNKTCPSYFRWIHEDLKHWKRTGITRKMIERARRKAHFRLVIVDGKAYVEQYRQSIQTRDIFTLWGILQLLRLYPGRLPDLELMFNCDDRPVVRSNNFLGPIEGPPLLFRAETNIRPWKHVLHDIKEGKERIKWKDRIPYAYWRGNPYVAPRRQDLLKCNVSDQTDWNTRLYIQNWEQESRQGYRQSNLGDQCTHRYKIYIEGWSWSVSEKYILACDSMALYIKPNYYDFFIRGMSPLQHYWPIRDDSKCTSLKFAVEWGNNHTEEAQAIGRAGSNFMHEDVKMDNVYDYMFHLLNEYAKLLQFKPTIPRGAVELCPQIMTCGLGNTHRKFMMESLVMSPSDSSPCTLPPPYSPLDLQKLIDRRIESTEKVEMWEIKYWLNSTKTINLGILPKTRPKRSTGYPLHYTLQPSNGTSTTKYSTLLAAGSCPEYFRWIHEDLRLWNKSGISREMVERAKEYANFRLVIVEGKVYVEKYSQCFQTRDVFTIWGILQLLKLYPDKVPDLELMFRCNDRTVIKKSDHQGPNATSPPVLFQYCGEDNTLSIVFPDWTFWEGNKRIKWKERAPYAYWKGNPYVTRNRQQMMRCNVSDKYDWKARLYQQASLLNDWNREMKQGYRNSKLEDQCTHRYKIYVEGKAWSVSDKYILACDSMTLLIKPKYYDFFLRSMLPMKHYWPIGSSNMCKGIKFAVEWGNNHTEKAQAIGEEGSKFIQENLKMEYVYDYMFHLLSEYAKLLKFKPIVPKGVIEVHPEVMASSADGLSKEYMVESMVHSPAHTRPCTMPYYDPHALQSLFEQRENVTKQLQIWENEYWKELNNIK